MNLTLVGILAIIVVFILYVLLYLFFAKRAQKLTQNCGKDIAKELDKLTKTLNEIANTLKGLK